MVVYPDWIRVETADKGWLHLSKTDRLEWRFGRLAVRLEETSQGYQVLLEAPDTGVSRLQLTFQRTFSAQTAFLGDAFERGYGDLGFQWLRPDRVMPWYFLAVEDTRVEGYGVMTGPNALCAWQVNEEAVDLWLDVRNGTNPLALGGRILAAATVVFSQSEGDSAFEAAYAFCQTMCPNPRLPQEPVYGGNDWYYAYGNNSRELILEHTRLVAELSPPEAVQPFMVIDDGWQLDHSPSYNGGPWSAGNGKFGAMQEVARQIKELGVRPGIWLRPLLTNTAPPAEQLLHGDVERNEYVLDISHPEVLRKIGEDFARMVDWGYEMIKHDFSTYDIFGLWGFQMNLDYAGRDIQFYDRTRTTAEIIKAFYALIRENCGAAYVIGCNTISHLAAGVFELQRTGDDTSGREFARTRKMGVNTLAFRMPQHNTFYLADADCVGITPAIPWQQNVQWLKALSESGTPLFISCNPGELTAGMKADLAEAFRRASRSRRPSVPLDWLTTSYPSEWKTEEGAVRYNWYQTPREYEA